MFSCTAGALSHAPTETIWARPGSASSSYSLHFCQNLSHLSTEDQRTPQCLQPHSCYTCQTSLAALLPLLSAHVFPRLTTNPLFMCITRSLNFTRQTGLGILIHVTVPIEKLTPLTDSGFALFAILFVYFFHLFWERF